MWIKLQFSISQNPLPFVFTLRASLIAQLVKNLPAPQETPVDSWVEKVCWRRDRLPTQVFLGSPCGSPGKKSAWKARDLGSIPGLGRSPGEGKGCPFRYSGLENSMDCIIHGVSKSLTGLSGFHFHFSHLSMDYILLVRETIISILFFVFK